MYQQFRAGERGRQHECRPGYCGHGGDGTVGDGVGERAKADHDEEFEAVVFEGEGEGGETAVVGDEARDPGGEEGAGGEEGGGGAEDGGGGYDEPAGCGVSGRKLACFWCC